MIPRALAKVEFEVQWLSSLLTVVERFFSPAFFYFYKFPNFPIHGTIQLRFTYFVRPSLPCPLFLTPFWNPSLKWLTIDGSVRRATSRVGFFINENEHLFLVVLGCPSFYPASPVVYPPVSLLRPLSSSSILYWFFVKRLIQPPTWRKLTRRNLSSIVRNTLYWGVRKSRTRVTFAWYVAARYARYSRSLNCGSP